MLEKQFINPPGLGQLGGFTHVVVARGGRTIYISGQVAYDAHGKLVGRGDLRAQTRQVCDNLKCALLEAGATWDDVVKITNYVVGYKPELRAEIIEVRNEYVSRENPPASTLVGVERLVSDDLLIEIEAIAVVD